MECKECKTIFDQKTTRQIYCNKICSRRYYNKHPILCYSEKCKNCNIEFKSSHKQIYCSLKCSNSKGNIFDTEKYREMGKKGAAKKYEGKTLLKDTIKVLIHKFVSL